MPNLGWKYKNGYPLILLWPRILLSYMMTDEYMNKI